MRQEGVGSRSRPVATSSRRDARNHWTVTLCRGEVLHTAAHLPQPAERPCGQRARTFLSFSERSSSAAPSIGYPQALEGFEVGLEELIEGGGAGIAGPVSEGTEGGVLSAPIAKLASEDAGRAVSCRAV